MELSVPELRILFYFSVMGLPSGAHFRTLTVATGALVLDECVALDSLNRLVRLGLLTEEDGHYDVTEKGRETLRRG